MDSFVSLFRNAALLELYGFEIPLVPSSVREYLFQSCQYKWSDKSYVSINSTNIGALAFILHSASVVLFLRSSFRNIFGSFRSGKNLKSWVNWTTKQLHLYDEVENKMTLLHILLQSKLTEMMTSNNYLLQIGCAQFIISHVLLFDGLSIAGVFDLEQFSSLFFVGLSLIIILLTIWKLVIHQLNHIKYMELAFSSTVSTVVELHKCPQQQSLHPVALSKQYIFQHLKSNQCRINQGEIFYGMSQLMEIDMSCKSFSSFEPQQDFFDVEFSTQVYLHELVLKYSLHLLKFVPSNSKAMKKSSGWKLICNDSKLHSSIFRSSIWNRSRQVCY